MISILTPTRNRPKELLRLADSVRATAQRSQEIVARIDDDEPQRAAYEAIKGVRLISGPRLVMSDLWNACSQEAQGDIQLLCGDDIVFRTPGWDALIEDAFLESPDKILLVHGDDLSPNGKKFGTHPALHRRWIEITGRFTCPLFSCDWADTWLNYVADMLGRRRYLPYVTEHMHWVFGKGIVDQTMRENMARRQRDDPAALFAKLEPERLAEVEKLRNAMVPSRWSILILTMPERRDSMARLRSCLIPQVARHPDVQVLVRTSDPSLSLGANRQALLDQAQGEYVSFIDDDDLVAPDFVDRVRPLLDGVDYVPFRVQQYADGVPLKPSLISLSYGGWSADEKHYYRDIVHVCPIRRVLALMSPMEGGYSEDARWGNRLRKLGVVRTEHVIEDVLYFYYWKSGKPVPRIVPKPVMAEWPSQRAENPDVTACPNCRVRGMLVPSNGCLHCNQCGANVGETA